MFDAPTVHDARPAELAAQIKSIVGERPCYLTFDIDCLDPVVMPAVIGAAQGGLFYDHLMAIFEGVAKRAPIVGFNLVEFMPARDVNNQGALMASRVALSMLGLIAKQRAGLTI